jgi:hypothetical protein
MNKLTFEVRKSVHTPDYPKDLWWNTFDNPMPKLPIGFNYSQRDFKTVDGKIIATTTEEKAIWDKEHPTPKVEPSLEERLATVEGDLVTVKADLTTLKTIKETPIK